MPIIVLKYVKIKIVVIYLIGGGEIVYRDEDLVTRSKNGDLQAFEELVCRYERKVYSLAYRMMGNYDDANDIAQKHS